MASSNLAKNTTFYTIALAAQKVLSFLFFIYVARIIGVENTGKFSFALSFTTIFAMVLDFGLTQVIIRESARDREKSSRYLSGVLGLKILGAVIIYLVVVILINILNYPEITRQLVYIAGAVMILDSFALSFYGILRGHHILKFESWGVIFNQLIVIIAGIIVLQLNLGLVFLISIYLAGSLFNFIYSAYALYRKEGVKFKPIFSKALFKELLILSLPFAIAGIFVRLYSYMDVVLLSKLADDQAVGLYSVAYKMTFALQFIGVASLAGVYPAFSAYFTKAPELLGKTFNQVLRYLMIFSIPITFGIWGIGREVIVGVFGASYEASVAAFQIMITALPLAFLCFPIGAMLNACNRQNINTTNLGVTAAVNIILNLILIPSFGYIGSAIAVILSYLVLFGMGIFFVNRTIAYDKKYLLKTFAKIILAAVVMFIAVLLLKEYMNFILVIIAGVIIYFAALSVVGGIAREDWRRALMTLKK